MVAYAREVLHTAAAHQHDAVLLQVVALSGNVAVNFLSVRKAHTSYLTHGGVRLLRGGRVHANTDAATLRTVVQSGALALVYKHLAAFPHELYILYIFESKDDANGHIMPIRAAKVDKNPQITMPSAQKNAFKAQNKCIFLII